MMTLEMKIDDVIDELGIKEVDDKTDAEFEKDNDNYSNVVDSLDILENDLLAHYKDLNVEMYIKLRQLDLMKKMVDKLDNLDMLYDVYKQLKKLANKQKQNRRKALRLRGFFYMVKICEKYGAKYGQTLDKIVTIFWTYFDHEHGGAKYGP